MNNVYNPRTAAIFLFWRNTLVSCAKAKMRFVPWKYDKKCNPLFVFSRKKNGKRLIRCDLQSIRGFIKYNFVLHRHACVRKAYDYEYACYPSVTHRFFTCVEFLFLFSDHVFFE